MADNYTLFSEIVRAVNAMERGWALLLLQAGEEVAADRLAAAGIGVDLELNPWPAFQWELLPSRPADLWVYSQDCGSPQQVSKFVQAPLCHFRPEDVWTLPGQKPVHGPKSASLAVEAQSSPPMQSVSSAPMSGSPRRLASSTDAIASAP